jgi:hypothetical protein
VRVLAVDWSGAAAPAAQRRGIWTACAEDGRLRTLVGGRTRDEAVDAVSRELDAGAALVGFDFSFSLPAWYLHALGVVDGPGLWDRVTAEGECWLASCEPPFWGQPGRRRPSFAGEDEFRRTERAAPPGARRPKSTFQVGGAGAVGTASLRGMPHLRRLRRAGVAVWPFDRAGSGPVVAEVYPRWWTGAVVKSSAAARDRHLAALRDGLPARLVPVASRSADAFDAACTALALSIGGWSLPAGDEIDRIEGRILLPPLR